MFTAAVARRVALEVKVRAGPLRRSGPDV